MKKYILLLTLIFTAFINLKAQSTSACTQTTDCFQFKLLGATRVENDQIKIMYAVKFLCNSNLNYVAFELPEGSKAATSSNIQHQNNDYIVRNGRTSDNGKNQIDTKFNAIQFNTKNNITKNNGQEDTFEFYLTNQDYNALASTGMRVEAKNLNGTTGQVSFNLNTCAKVTDSGQASASNCRIDLSNAVFSFYEAVDTPDGNTRVRFAIQNKTSANVSQVLIETPSTTQNIDVVGNGNVYRAKYHYKTNINQEANLITFDAQNTNGYANGSIDEFTVIIPTSVYDVEPYFQLTVKAGTVTTNTGFNTQTCEDAPITPLPVELISFEGIATQSGIALEWSTASESDNLGFEVERSQDAKSFAAIDFVAGAGNSLTKNNYSYTDKTAGLGTFYYRLKQLDTNGNTAYSKLILVQQHKVTAKDNLSVYPNPATGNYLTIDLHNKITQQANVELQIMNMNGHIEFSKTITSGNDRIELSIPDLSLPSGVYMVRLQHDAKTETKKLVIP